MKQTFQVLLEKTTLFLEEIVPYDMPCHLKLWFFHSLSLKLHWDHLPNCHSSPDSNILYNPYSTKRKQKIHEHNHSCHFIFFICTIWFPIGFNRMCIGMLISHFIYVEHLNICHCALHKATSEGFQCPQVEFQVIAQHHFHHCHFIKLDGLV